MTWCRISAVEIIVSPGPVPLSSPSISCTFIRTHQLALTLRAQDPSYLTFAVDVKLIFTCFAPLVSVEVELQPCGADARAAFNNGLGLAKFSSTVYWIIYYWHIDNILTWCWRIAFTHLQLKRMASSKGLTSFKRKVASVSQSSASQAEHVHDFISFPLQQLSTWNRGTCHFPPWSKMLGFMGGSHRPATL
jgi:hypothetical protein